MNETPNLDTEIISAGKQEVVAQKGPAPEPGFNPEFIDVLRKYFTIELIKESFRITPKGLFVVSAFKDKLIEAYQKWLEEIGLPPAARTLEKITRRIFEGENAHLYFLSEGKLTLTGYLATASIQQPQRYQLPFYLGSLSDSRSELYAEDPIFSSTKGLSAQRGKQGIEIFLELQGDKYSIPQPAIKEFIQKAEQSHRTMKEFPNLKNSPAESLQALVVLLQKSRPLANAKEPRLLPQRLVKSKRVHVRAVGSYEFIFGPQRELLAVLDLKAKNLAQFVAQEMSLARKKGERRIGIFDFAGERERHLGIFNIKGRKVRLATHALAGFVEHVGDSPEKRDRFLQDYTVRECFEKFSILYQTSQPIDGKLISSFVSEFKLRGTRFFVNGAWIFVLSPDGLLSHCLARHARKKSR
jgi:hypothetical protein